MVISTSLSNGVPYKYRHVLAIVLLVFSNNIRYIRLPSSPSFIESTRRHFPNTSTVRNKIDLKKRIERAGANQSDFAYVYLMGGVDPKDPSTYLGFLYNVLASTYILRKDGPEADVVIYLQWKHQYENNSLSDTELRVLREMDISLSIQQIYKTNDHFFERLQMEKFHLWKMIQYKRIMYLDADVFPLCNLDYIFRASTCKDAIIKPNLVFPGIKVPANGGAFLLEPSLQDHKRLQNLIDVRFKQSNQSFDEVRGWGRAIKPSETWYNHDGTVRGDKWDFYAAHVDQGLLWHWMRYEKGTFSVPFPYPDGRDYQNGFNRSQAVVENWVNGELVSIQPFDFNKYSCLPRHITNMTLMKFIKRPWSKSSQFRYPFHSDFVHFQEKSKPWTRKTPSQDKIVEKARDSTTLWYYALKQVNELYDLGVDWSSFGTETMTVKHMKARSRDIT